MTASKSTSHEIYEVQIAVLEEAPDSLPDDIFGEFIKYSGTYPGDLKPDLVVALRSTLERLRKQILEGEFGWKATLSIAAAWHHITKIHAALWSKMQQDYRREIRFLDRCIIELARTVDMSKLEWRSSRPKLLEVYLKRKYEQAQALNKQGAGATIETREDAVRFLSTLGVENLAHVAMKKPNVFSYSTDDMSSAIDTQRGGSGLYWKFDLNDFDQYNNEMLSRISKVLPHFKVALLAAGCTEQQASDGVEALFKAVAKERSAPVSAPDASQKQALWANPVSTPDQSPSANLQAREQGLWDIALDRAGASLGERGRALTALGQLYRLAGQGSVQEASSAPKRGGRPKGSPDEDLLDIIIDPDLDQETRYRAMATLQSRWQRLMRKAP